MRTQKTFQGDMTATNANGSMSSIRNPVSSDIKLRDMAALAYIKNLGSIAPDEYKNTAREAFLFADAFLEERNRS